MNGFDAYLYKLINQQMVSDTMDFLMLKFSDKYFWIPFYCVVIWMLARAYKKKTLLILLCLGISVVASDRTTSGFMKPFFGRQRPCHEVTLTPRLIDGVHCSETGSMASSHAANHFAVALFLSLLFGLKRWSNVAFWLIWAGAVSYSRVYLGVHYPTDVIAGSAVGVVYAYLTYKLYLFLLKKSKWE